jgi:hypothetical protein
MGGSVPRLRKSIVQELEFPFTTEQLLPAGYATWRCGIEHRGGSSESVSSARKRLNEIRISGGVAECAPKFEYVHLDSFGLNEGFRPDLV